MSQLTPVQQATLQTLLNGGYVSVRVNGQWLTSDVLGEKETIAAILAGNSCDPRSSMKDALHLGDGVFIQPPHSIVIDHRQVWYPEFAASLNRNSIPYSDTMVKRRMLKNSLLFDHPDDASAVADFMVNAWITRFDQLKEGN